MELLPYRRPPAPLTVGGALPRASSDAAHNPDREPTATGSERSTSVSKGGRGGAVRKREVLEEMVRFANAFWGSAMKISDTQYCSPQPRGQNKDEISPQPTVAELISVQCL